MHHTPVESFPFFHSDVISHSNKRITALSLCNLSLSTYFFVSTWLPRWHSGKEPPCQCGRPKDSGRGKSPGVGNRNPPHYACLGNSVDRGAWQAAVHRGAESAVTERLRKHPFLPFVRCLELVIWCVPEDFVTSYSPESVSSTRTVSEASGKRL